MNLEEPLNPTERLLYGINIRLDAVIQQLNSIVEVIANQNNIAIEENKVVQEVKKDGKIKRERKKVKS